MSDVTNAYRARLAKALGVLRSGEGGWNKPLMRQVGVLAARLCLTAKVSDWAQLKHNLPETGLRSLLATLEREGRRLQQAELRDAVNAIDTIALSLIGTLHEDALTLRGTAQIDSAIEIALAAQRRRASTTANSP